MYRVMVLSTFLKVCVPINKINDFRDLLEEYAFRLAGRKPMSDDHVGDHFDTPVLYDFGTSWVSLFFHSLMACLLLRTRTGQAMWSYSQTRWWSRWEVYQHLMDLFADVLPFLKENPDLAPATRRELLAILQDTQKSS